MARKKPSALEALAKYKQERRLLEDRGVSLREAAALELGMIVLEAGGDALDRSVLAALVRGAVEQGRSDFNQRQDKGAAKASTVRSGGTGDGGNG